MVSDTIKSEVIGDFQEPYGAVRGMMPPGDEPDSAGEVKEPNVLIVV